MNRQQFLMSLLAPIFGAFGFDYEKYKLRKLREANTCRALKVLMKSMKFYDVSKYMPSYEKATSRSVQWFRF